MPEQRATTCHLSGQVLYRLVSDCLINSPCVGYFSFSLHLLHFPLCPRRLPKWIPWKDALFSGFLLGFTEQKHGRIRVSSGLFILPASSLQRSTGWTVGPLDLRFPPHAASLPSVLIILPPSLPQTWEGKAARSFQPLDTALSHVDFSNTARASVNSLFIYLHLNYFNLNISCWGPNHVVAGTQHAMMIK